MVRSLHFLVIACALIAFSRQIYLLGCPWYSREIVTTFARHPDVPCTQFVAGKVGVLLPSYATSYHVIAYRYFQGIGMNGGEQSQANLYFRDKQNYNPWDATAPDWAEEWDRATRPFGLPVPQPPKAHRFSYETNSYELNCAEDAFRVATFTLRDRLKRVGSKSPFFSNWLQAQHAVFGACGGNESTALPALPAAAPAWLRQDRAYQTAAWHFYRGERDASIHAFQAVSADPASPWRILARYLVIRAMTRGVQRDSAQYPEVAREIDRVLKDRQLSSIHGAVRVLRRRNLIIAKPEETLDELARSLTSRGIDLSLRQDLWDFVALFQPIERSKNTRKLAKEHELSDWLTTLHEPDAESAEHARQQWRASQSTAWLVAAISNTIASDDGVESLLDAASKLSAQDPAYVTIAYHRARILAELRRYDEAQAIAEACLRRDDLGRSSQNLFAMIRGQSMADLTGFLKALPRRPVLVHYNASESEAVDPQELPAMPKQYLSFVDAQTLNHRTPLSLLAEMALAPDLPDGLSIELRRVALMRALILKREELYRPLATALSSFAPYRSKLEAALANSDPDSLRNALLRFTIHQPEIHAHFLKSGPDWLPVGKLTDSRDDYWPELIDQDSLSFEQEGSWAKCNDEEKMAKPIAYRILEGTEPEAQAEWAALKNAGAASRFYMQHADAHYASHPKDPSNAELLGGAVKVWNNSRRQEADLPLASRVWRILQLKYPKSYWAVRYKSGVMFAYRNEPNLAAKPSDYRNHFPGVRCRFEY